MEVIIYLWVPNLMEQMSRTRTPNRKCNGLRPLNHAYLLLEASSTSLIIPILQKKQSPSSSSSFLIHLIGGGGGMRGRNEFRRLKCLPPIHQPERTYSYGEMHEVELCLNLLLVPNVGMA